LAVVAHPKSKAVDLCIPNVHNSVVEIEFDPRKAAANQRKHNVSFEEAASCLLDPQALVMEDGRSEGETRWLLVGMSARARLLTVVYTLREDNPRLISARKATTRESKSYAT
jgi:uncharacterized DUF497 family protein